MLNLNNLGDITKNINTGDIAKSLQGGIPKEITDKLPSELASKVSEVDTTVIVKMITDSGLANKPLNEIISEVEKKFNISDDAIKQIYNTIKKK